MTDTTKPDPDTRHGPLEDLHRTLGAKLGPFGGWLMPIEYRGVLSEHRAVRERVGLFDLSHLGKVDVLGASAGGPPDRAAMMQVMLRHGLTPAAPSSS